MVPTVAAATLAIKVDVDSFHPVEVLFKVYDSLPIDDIVLRIRSISTPHYFAVCQWRHLRVIKSFLNNDSFLTIHMLRGTGSTQNATVQTAYNNGTTILPPFAIL